MYIIVSRRCNIFNEANSALFYCSGNSHRPCVSDTVRAGQKNKPKKKTNTIKSNGREAQAFVRRDCSFIRSKTYYDEKSPTSFQIVSQYRRTKYVRRQSESDGATFEIPLFRSCGDLFPAGCTRFRISISQQRCHVTVNPRDVSRTTNAAGNRFRKTVTNGPNTWRRRKNVEPMGESLKFRCRPAVSNGEDRSGSVVLCDKIEKQRPTGKRPGGRPGKRPTDGITKDSETLEVTN